MLKNTAI
jgi:signal transduction histidine kinase